MKVIVCGGRDYDNWRRVYSVLTGLFPDSSVPLEIATGGANGADKIAIEYAVARAVPHQVFLADWAEYGKRAGPLRNARMLREFAPDLVIAFPGGKGTADMVARARKAGVRVTLVPS